MAILILRFWMNRKGSVDQKGLGTSGRKNGKDRSRERR